MKLSQETLNLILEMSLEQAYQFYLVCKLENPALQQYYDEIRYGINEHFDINDLFNNFISIRPKNSQVSIRGKIINIQDYYTEKEQRHAQIIKAVLDHMTEPDNLSKPVKEPK